MEYIYKGNIPNGRFCSSWELGIGCTFEYGFNNHHLCFITEDELERDDTGTLKNENCPNQEGIC